MPQNMTPRELADRLKAGQQVCLIDVRQPEENQFARLPDSVLIPMGELAVRSNEVQPDPGVPVVVYCHHGVRSWKAAVFLESSGLSPVFSLSGGIDAWSLTVDPQVPRY